jgi:hypothetical protein
MNAYLRPFARTAAFCLAAGIVATLSVHAGGKKNNPTSKFYVADVDGDAQIDTGQKVDDLTKKSVYNAEGTVVETRPNGTNAMVFSNGTGVFFDPDTRMEVKKFEQEPFVPNRTDMDTEPSISQTQNYVPRGTVGLCTSKLAAGSSMNYSTPLGSVNLHGGKVVVATENNATTISMIEGESEVNAGVIDTGGHRLKNGEQAVITPGANGAPPQIKIQAIPNNQVKSLNQKVTMACNAKKTVYFEAVGNRRTDTIIPLGAGQSPDTGYGTKGPAVTAFDGNDGTTTPDVTSNPSTTTQQTIVAVPTAPANTPVAYDSTQSRITTTKTPAGG